jgi:hypothetical protein
MPPRCQSPGWFQSLEGFAVNCRRAAIRTNSTSGWVSIPRRVCSKLSLVNQLPLQTYQLVSIPRRVCSKLSRRSNTELKGMFQSLEGFAVNCRFIFNASNGSTKRFQSLEGFAVNCRFIFNASNGSTKRFQSLEGFAVNCRWSINYHCKLTNSFQSLEGFAVNCRRVAGRRLLPTVPVFQSLEGFAVNCRIRGGLSRLGLVLFQSLEGFAVNCRCYSEKTKRDCGIVSIPRACFKTTTIRQ